MENSPSQKPEETPTEIAKQPSEDDATHKGYNEKTPAQPQGAFKPNNANDKKDKDA